MARFQKGSTKPPGSGRKPGSLNKLTVELRQMILGALSDVGGQAYLARQAEENPQAFLSLLGRVLPKEIKAQVERERVEVRNYTGLDRAVLDEAQALLAARQAGRLRKAAPATPA